MRKLTYAIAAATCLMAGAASAQDVVTTGTPGTTGATALYITDPAALTASEALTAAERTSFLGRPDDLFTGLGGGFVTYDLGDFRLINGVGQDFNVYELDSGANNFGFLSVLVSADGVAFFNVTSTQSAGLDLAGDEAHAGGGLRQSYNLAGAVTALGVSQFRFVRLDGPGTSEIGDANLFDLDGIGFANFINVGTQPGVVPEPATWGLMIAGFGAVGGAMRRSRRAASGLRTA